MGLKSAAAAGLRVFASVTSASAARLFATPWPAAAGGAFAAGFAAPAVAIPAGFTPAFAAGLFGLLMVGARSNRGTGGVVKADYPRARRAHLRRLLLLDQGAERAAHRERELRLPAVDPSRLDGDALLLGYVRREP